MKQIGFITNIQKDPDLSFTKKLIDFVIEKGCIPLLSETTKKCKCNGCKIMNGDDIYKKSDFAVVMGGDGTILRVAGKSSIYNLPILGINLGTLGYLAEVEKNDAKNAIEAVLDGNYTIEKRMMIEASTINGENESEKKIALNEVAVNNGGFSRMLEISLEINNQYVDTFRADGIIISTPTGSTAYNLSAGGPILKPDTELMAVTYVCPHALFSRPYVVSGNDTVKISIGGNYNNVILSLDGRQTLPINQGSSIIVRRSKYCTSIIKTTKLSFYDILRRKMVEARK